VINWSQRNFVTGTNTEGTASNHYFGRNIAINSSGNIILIGAQQESPNNIYYDDAGSAYIFSGNGSNWTKIARITGKDLDFGFNFGASTAINSIGNIALVGAIGAKPIGASPVNNFGAAYIFTGNGNSWAEAAKITGKQSLAGQFGQSVALNAIGNTALIGAAIGNYAFIFTGSGNNWIQTAELSGSGIGGFFGDFFGNNACLNGEGNVALIGAHQANPNGNANAGVVYVFTGSGNSWAEAAKITGNDTEAGDRFGFSASINSAGNIALIGAYTESPNGKTEAGSAYVFTGSGSNWIQVAKISGGDDTPIYGRFGYSTALNSIGNTAFIGATNSKNSEGSLFIFTGSGNNWVKKEIITGNSPGNIINDFGSSVDVNSDGNILAVGDPSMNLTGVIFTNAGGAFIFTEKLNQTITFSAIPTKTLGDSPFFLNATSTSSLPVEFNSSNPNIATIVGSGVTIVGAGTCEITGYQTGNFDYKAATPVARTLTVLRGSQTINLPSFYTGIYNETKVYDTSTPQGLPLIYTGNTNIFSISANNITFINTGITILTGYNTGSTNYTGITGTQQVTVNRANGIIDFPYIPVFNVNITSGYTLNATSNHNESTITYTSSNSGAASISGANTLLITGTGVGIITAYQPATSHYNEASGQRSFTALDLRNPQIVAVSNLPNNVFFDTGSKYLQGYLQDEGTYHLKLHILEDNILCEKTIVLNVIDTGVKHLYKINYPINIGFIKYNAPQRLGL
jgi:hypothetical protein